MTPAQRASQVPLTPDEFVLLWYIERQGITKDFATTEINPGVDHPLSVLQAAGLIAKMADEYTTTLEGHEWLRITGVLVKPVEFEQE